MASDHFAWDMKKTQRIPPTKKHCYLFAKNQGFQDGLNILK